MSDEEEHEANVIWQSLVTSKGISRLAQLDTELQIAMGTLPP